ncbi:Heavy metal-associated isoprenylated plant protein 22 [Vitis vinifera]|uniref:Heavy metal-associated isoprenylated plant protein 22 n=1 Tax=Vitis vinifera TaxID=29760 RepID=A0A438C1A3_VITVI|nr:Heavy metal-associated isoprenylated plant protein 22 [Vitis vinifera]
MYCYQHKEEQRKPMQTVDIKVKMDCDGCERRVKNAVSSMKGTIQSLSNQIKASFSRSSKRIAGHSISHLPRHPPLINFTISICGALLQPLCENSGYKPKAKPGNSQCFVDPNKVLKRVKSTGKRAEFWPYVPYNLVYYPYIKEAYDKKAPSGYVKNVVQALPSPSATDERLTTLFSDDNPNACSIITYGDFIGNTTFQGKDRDCPFSCHVYRSISVCHMRIANME